jgi:hypothetical protein
MRASVPRLATAWKYRFPCVKREPKAFVRSLALVLKAPFGTCYCHLTRHWEHGSVAAEDAVSAVYCRWLAQVYRWR